MKISKRVLYAVPFFCALLSGNSIHAECLSSYFDETAQVRQVHDGDTLNLTDGRKVRIIGINTPELARDDQPAEPFARQATQALKQLLKQQKTIKLRYGTEKQDRYGRLLAHVFLENGQNITELMLEKGMGLALVIPPNLWRSHCYQDAEQSAQQKHRGLWLHPRYQPVDARQLTVRHRGYYRITGTVLHIGESRSAYWLKLSDIVTLKISKSDQHYFHGQPVQRLKGKTLIARGWIYKSRYKNRDEIRMRIRHPAALDVVE